MGKGALSDIKYFVHHLAYCAAMFTEILRRAIPEGYRPAVSMRSSLLFGNDRPDHAVVRIRSYEE
jgi:hypothetical protein